VAFKAATLDETSLRNMREFLETYNKMSEQCFNRCVVSLHDRGLSEEEQSCADLCTEINVKVNHKVLDSFMVEQPRINQEKMEKMEAEAAQMAAKMNAIDEGDLTSNATTPQDNSSETTATSGSKAE